MKSEFLRPFGKHCTRFGLPIFALAWVSTAAILPLNQAYAAEQAKATAPKAARADELAEALQAEFSAQAGRTEEAAKLYLQAAKKANRADYAENATRYALSARNFVLAEAAAQLWLELAKDDVNARQALGFTFAVQGKKPEAQAQIRALLLSPAPSAFDLALGLMSAQDASGITVALLDELAKDTEISALPIERGIVPIALKLKRSDLALNLARARTQAEPKNPKTWLWQGLSELGEKNVSAAADSYRKALDLDPKNTRLRLSLVQILNDLKRDKEIDMVLRDVPEPSETIYQARMSLYATNKDRKSMKALAREIQKSDALSINQRQFLLGASAEMIDDKKTALKWYQAVEKGENWPQAQLRAAVVLADMKKLPRALEVLQNLQAATAADQSIIDAYMLEAELLNKAKLAADAQKVLDAAIERFEQAADLRYARAMTALALKDIKTMESDLRVMTEIDPQNAQAWNALGYSLLVETDRVDEAFDLIQRAFALDSRSGAIMDSMGWAFFKRGRFDQAVPLLRQAYAAEPEAEVAAHLGEALWELGAKKEALETFTEARKRFPDSEILQATIKRLKVVLP